MSPIVNFSPKGGRLKHPEYRIWKGMRSRCMRPADKDFQHYGGRGITICREWDEFWNFVRDIGPRPDSTYTLERMDTNGSYCAENCQWADRVRQNNNRTNNRLVWADGVRDTIANHCTRLNFRRQPVREALSLYTEKANYDAVLYGGVLFHFVKSDNEQPPDADRLANMTVRVILHRSTKLILGHLASATY